MQPSIIAEDQHYIFINKPSRLDSSSVVGGREDTVTRWMGETHPRYAAFGYKPEDNGLLNRLDYETSGVMIAAKSEKARDAFLELTRDDLVEKTYCAFVHGILLLDEPVDAYIGSRSRNSKTVRVFNEPRKKDRALSAYTRFVPGAVCEERNVSLVLAEIRQGRRHQIRVHASHAGFPLIGDSLYGSTETVQGFIGESPDTFLLHSRSMSFTHPFTEKTISVLAPFPESFKKLRENLSWRELFKDIFA